MLYTPIEGLIRQLLEIQSYEAEIVNFMEMKRKSKCENVMTDIFDATRYKDLAKLAELPSPAKPPMGHFLTYMLNIDGVKCSKSSSQVTEHPGIILSIQKSNKE